jgi:transcriptional regulator with XRE-family HTH domain
MTMKLEEYRRKLQQDPEYLAAEEELKPLLDLADDILSLRLEKGWSQSKLAKRVGTKQANISRVESGLGNPTFQFLQKVARALGTEVEIRLKSQRKGIEFTKVKEIPIAIYFQETPWEKKGFDPAWVRRNRNPKSYRVER